MNNNLKYLVHDIALEWKTQKRQLIPYDNFDEYLLFPSYAHDMNNHIHIFYDINDNTKKQRPGYIIKIKGKHLKKYYLSNKYSANKWCDIIYNRLIKCMKQKYKSIKYTFINCKGKTIKNQIKSIKNKTKNNK
jgi:hypothetical protein